MANRKLTDIQRQEIIDIHKERKTTYYALAKLYGVSPPTIRRICNQDLYKKELSRNAAYRQQRINPLKEQRKNSVRNFSIQLTRSTSEEMIEFLESKPNVQEYIKSLISKDMEDHKNQNCTK